MCGICGQYNYKNHDDVVLEDIKRMTRTMVHRGPDDEGFYLSGSLGLGFRRLSIIDIQGGHQPMSDIEESVWVVFNGEIYNFPELKSKLETCGHVFRTRSDTEVIVHGYKEWGTEIFNQLNGMFGIAIWDVRKRKLVLARDPMGIKLIYYKIEDSRVWFGSEIRPILALNGAMNGNRPDIDPVALNLFLRYRYTPSPYTIYKGIKKLAPGTMLEFENGESRLTRWYGYSPDPFFPSKSADEIIEELLDLYKQSLKRHLLSDVPLGLLLSGGIDSGLLLALMNLYGDQWPTFTIGYGKSFKDDELSDAAETARILSAPNHSVYLDRDIFEEALPKIVSCLEEPIASSSIVPMYFVCQRAREDVKVALIGQGPDELFGGYPRHLGVRYGNYWRAIPKNIRALAGKAANTLPRNETLKRGIYSLGISDRLKRYQHVFSIVPGSVIDGLFHKDALPVGAGDAILDCWKDLGVQMENIDDLNAFHVLELRSSLPDELLMYADKLSMAHSLEVRVPYLDRELVEYVQRIPAELKIRNSIQKWAHRKVCNNFLPKKIISRKKRGFAVNVVDSWFNDSMNNKMDSIFQDPTSLMYSVLRPEQTNKLLKEHKSGKNNNHKILFSLVVFEEWLRSL